MFCRLLGGRFRVLIAIFMELVDPDLVANAHVPFVARLAAFDSAAVPLIGNASEQGTGETHVTLVHPSCVQSIPSVQGRHRRGHG